jgi:general secretion pathway protein L
VRDILYLHLRDSAPDATLAYALVPAQPGAGIQAQRGTLDAICALAAGRRVVAFVAGADVRLAAVQVPARDEARVLQAAPYVLEDQLAEDVDTLHFAIGAPGSAAGGAHPVAIVARARMAAWLDGLRERAVRPDALLPETLCLPSPEAGHWTGLAESGRVTVRTGAWTGFSCALDDLASYLLIADPDARAAVRLFVTRDVEFDFSRAGRPLELLPGYGSGLEVLARHWQPSASINLLQGAYSGKQAWQGPTGPWRIAATLAAAWLVVASTGYAVDTWRLGRELAAQTGRNFARCQQVFPKDCVSEPLVPDVVERQARVLRAGAGGAAPLFELLGGLSAALQAAPGLTLESLELREGALYLGLTGGDLQALEKLRAWYDTRRDARLEVETANAGSSGVQVRVKLTPA